MVGITSTTNKTVMFNRKARDQPDWLRHWSRGLALGMSFLLAVPHVLAGPPIEAADAEKCEAVDEWATTTMAPPPFVMSWRRHLEIISQIGAGADLVILGDSMALNWPRAQLERRFPNQRIVNLGVAGDRTQHVLWRLSAPELAALKPQRVILFLGTNNLSAKDKACAITLGMKAVVQRVVQVWNKPAIDVILIPPRGPQGSFRTAERQTVNDTLKREAGSLGITPLDPEPLLGTPEPGDIYGSDLLHIKRDAYARLTLALP